MDKHYGKHRGIVTDTADPSNLGRIKAKVPEILKDVPTGWALPAAPYAGDGVGLWTIPPAGAGVWIEFEAGDVSRPIWAGCWWAKDQRPKDNDGDQATPSLKILRSAKGLIVSFDDDAQTIDLSDEHGDNLVTIEVQAGKVTVKGKTKVVVEAPLIELVENATHPVVFGDNLLNYLNQIVQTYATHMHPGQMALGVLPVTPAPPAVPFQPATPSLLSTKVTTG